MRVGVYASIYQFILFIVIKAAGLEYSTTQGVNRQGSIPVRESQPTQHHMLSHSAPMHHQPLTDNEVGANYYDQFAAPAPHLTGHNLPQLSAMGTNVCKVQVCLPPACATCTHLHAQVAFTRDVL